jgi:hypothetical protein
MVIFQPTAATRATAQVKELGDSKTWQVEVHDVEGAPPAEREAYEIVRAMKPEGSVPRTSWDGKPDFNGVYYPYVAMEPAPVDLDTLYKPEVQALRKRLHPEIEPNMMCYPNIFPVSFTRQHGFAVFQGPGVFVPMLEVFGVFRAIPIVDGPPKHDPNIRPTFQGHSVAYWEGDTLVVDTVRFNGKGWLFRDVSLTSDALHIVERWTRPDSRMIEYQAVAEDPTMLTGKWTSPKMRRGQLLQKDTLDYDPCLEDSRETALTLEALKIDPAQLQLTRDVLLQGAHTILAREVAKRGTK